MVCPRGPTTRSGTGKTRRRRTVAPPPCARAATSGTIVSLRARALIGAKIRFAIVSLLSFCDAAAGSVDSHGRDGNPVDAAAHQKKKCSDRNGPAVRDTAAAEHDGDIGRGPTAKPR